MSIRLTVDAELCGAAACRIGAMRATRHGKKGGARCALPFAPRPRPDTRTSSTTLDPVREVVGREQEFWCRYTLTRRVPRIAKFGGSKTRRFRFCAGAFPNVNNRLGVAVRDMSKGQKWPSK